MEHSRPLTSPQPWEDFPVPEEALFPVPGPGGARPTEVMVILPEEGDRVVMHIVASDEDAERAVALAFREARKLDGYEMTVKAF
jgi:hypothetical protein